MLDLISKSLLNRIIGFFFLVFLTSQLTSAQNLTGPTSVLPNSTHTYYFDNGARQLGATWLLSSIDATVVSSGTVGGFRSTNYYATIQWGAVGSSVINFMKNFTALGTLNVVVQAPAPATPSAPTVQSNNCSNTVLARSTPPTGETWYWQSSSTGTSTSNSSSTVTRTSGTIYYLRARNNSSGTWSTNSSSVNYSINTLPSIPNTPIINNNNNCGSVILTKGDSPSGITWYWQSSSTGTSTSSSSTSITLTNGTVYYLRARNNSTGCWSIAKTINYNIKAVPAIPNTPTITNNCGNTVLTRGSTPSGISWYWQSNSTGTSTSNSSSSVTLTSGTVYYLRAKDNRTDCWSSTRTINYSVNAVPGTPSTPTITNTCGSTILTKGSSPSGITWYWQSSSTGTSTSNSSSTLTRTSGTVYYLRARNNTTSCWSSTRTINYSVNVVPGTPSTPTITNTCGSTILTKGSSPSGITWYWQSSSTDTSTSNSSSTLTRTSGTVYYLRARNNTTNCWGSARSINYSVNTFPAIPSTPTITNTCGSTVLAKGNSPSGITWYWQSSSTGTSISNSSSTLTQTSGTVYYLRARNNTTSCWSSARTINYNVSQPTTWYADTDNDSYGDSASTMSACSQPSGYVSNNNDYDDNTINITNIAPQNFYTDVDADGFGDPDDSVFYSVMPSGYVTDNTDECPNEAGSYNGCDYTSVVLSDENYIYTRVYQEPMDNQTEINQDSDIIERITYFDGLGRPMQSTNIKASPDKKDIITHIGYDNFGRQDKDWLPYHEITGNVGGYRTDDMELNTKTYYQNQYTNDFNNMDLADINAYSQKEFEASPLSRVLKQAAPGKDWKLGHGNEIEFEYLTNTDDEVRRFEVNTTSTTVNNVVTYEPNLDLDTSSENNDGYYEAKMLYKTVIKDENHDGNNSKNHTTEEFKDKQGRVVLKRTYAPVGSPSTVEIHDTYYIYDDYGNLTYVLSPKMDAHTNGLTTINNQLNELGYQYKYDDRNRLVEKKIPGKGWESIVYNKLDQPILMQDANLNTQNKWLFTKYDVFGRAAYTGLMNSNSNRITLQNLANSASTQYVTKSASPATVSGTTLYYSNDSSVYPTTGISEIHTINYYDNYTFNGFSNLPSSSGGQNIINNDNTDPLLTKGLPTCSKVRVLGEDDWITTTTGYDIKGRPIYVKSENDYLGTTDIIENTLDFLGAVDKTVTSHTKGTTSVTTEDLFTYDHIGRLKKHTQELNNTNVLEVIVENTYDELGQLTNKGVGGKTTQGRLQNIDYTYNVRGWLKQINNPTALETNLFGFKINYNTVDHGGTKLFNGNISETEWKTANSDNGLKWYTYNYDALNRITSAINATNTNYNLKSVAYDKNGNIINLERRGHINSAATSFDTMDDLVYTYLNNSNKLVKVQDNSNSIYGFKDGPNTAAEYTYDANGNMLTDANKGISTNITYNHLNLPTQVVLGGGNISYIYDATGAKLKKIVSTGATTEYAGNHVYENGSLKFFNHPEGYFDVTNPPTSGELEGDYVYQYKDHLGNVRLSYSDTDGNGSITAATEILEENNYYPFGLKHKGYNDGSSTAFANPALDYQYNGVEYEESLGLNLYEMELRQYDPAIARWTSIDPVTHFSNSTYNAFDNNPIYWADPSGANSIYNFKTGQYVINGTVVTQDEAIAYAQNGGNADGSNNNTPNEDSNSECCGTETFANWSEKDKAWFERNPKKAKVIKSAAGRAGKLEFKGTGTVSNNDGYGDALRHSYWMYLITKELGPEAAKEFGDFHEDILRDDGTNNNEDRRGQMDLNNNYWGINFALNNKESYDVTDWGREQYEYLQAFDNAVLNKEIIILDNKLTPKNIKKRIEKRRTSRQINVYGFGF